MLMIYPPADAPPAGDPAEQLARWQDYTVSLEEAGVVVTHARLQDAHAATTVRVRDGERLVNDGPFAETKEYLAGFYVVECADLDAALGHAARMPNVDVATIEVRPLMFPVATSPAAMGTRAQG
jgi:hypothetical protein